MARAKKPLPTLDGLLFVTPEQKLLRFLISEPTTAFTPRTLSSKLKGVLNTEDIIAAMKKLHLKEDSIFFKDIDEDFEEKVHSIQKSSSLQKKLTQLSQEIKNQRSWNVIGRRYYEEIFA